MEDKKYKSSFEIYRSLLNGKLSIHEASIEMFHLIGAYEFHKPFIKGKH